MRILFVCLGNICRSPTAEAAMRGLVAEAGLEDEIEIESAGTGDWHVGYPPDERSVAAAAERGVELTGEARQVAHGDFEKFDLLIAMDGQNRDDLLGMAQSEADREKVRLLRSYADGDLDVPDPYYGGDDSFGEVVEIVERSCEALLEQVSPDLR
ncbi:MAG: low molecular weight protein-tyrosine-phosphatase [Solirubrobacterales bacterium]